MSPSPSPTERREHPWHLSVAFTARGLAGFLCRVAWFAVFVKILLFT